MEQYRNYLKQQKVLSKKEKRNRKKKILPFEVETPITAMYRRRFECSYLFYRQ
jgi:hypothetical protein